MCVWESVPVILAGCDSVWLCRTAGDFVGLCVTVTNGVSVCDCIVERVCECIVQGKFCVTVWIIWHVSGKVYNCGCDSEVVCLCVRAVRVVVTVWPRRTVWDGGDFVGLCVVMSLYTVVCLCVQVRLCVCAGVYMIVSL